jgi:hypothetical protein
MKQTILLALSCGALSCGPHDNCEPQSTRCSGNTAQVCDADRDFQDIADCDAVSKRSGTPFVCGAIDEVVDGEHVKGHTCLPKEDE